MEKMEIDLDLEYPHCQTAAWYSISYHHRLPSSGDTIFITTKCGFYSNEAFQYKTLLLPKTIITNFQFIEQESSRQFLLFKMSAKLAIVCVAFCLVFLLGIEGSFIKANNVPRVGRSNEGEIFEDGDDDMGYVIKTNKNIPRIGRRNYDSVRFYYLCTYLPYLLNYLLVGK